MRTINLARMYQANVHQQMQFLQKNFTISNKVNYEDGTSEEVVRWISADAEQQYLILQERFRQMKENEITN